MAKMICLCGISGSGKTTWAKQFMAEHSDWLYFSPDEYYARINGDECDRQNTFEVWHSLFRDVHTAAVNNKNVLIDSNNLTFHQRMQWIEWFPEFEDFILIYFEVDFIECCNRVAKRNRKIPKWSMIHQYEQYENPLNYQYRNYNHCWNYIIKGGKDNDSLLAEALNG